MPRVSIRSISRPALAKPTRSLRCSIEVEPNWRGHHQLDGLQEHVHVVADVGVDSVRSAAGLAAVTPSV